MTLLKKELAECMLQPSFRQGVENCFHTAGHYWADVKTWVIKHDFPSPCEEIYFFKRVKPFVTTELEYYGLVYHSLLFCPPDAELKKPFWKRERARLTDFIKQQDEFLRYYRSGMTANDQWWYTRDQEGSGITHYPTYDRDNRARSKGDPLLARFWALQKYAVYVKEKYRTVYKEI